MIFLDIATVVCVGLMIGTEFTVSAFINPILWQLEERAQAQAIGISARKLGRAMPFWYVASLLLMAVEAIARYRQPGEWLLGGAIAIWVAVIVLTLLFLVPVANRLARLSGDTFSAEARREQRHWDTMHRMRVAALVLAMICLLAGLRL